MRLTKDNQTIVGLRVSLGSKLYDSDCFDRLDEEKVLLSKELVQLLEWYCDEQTLVFVIKARNNYPFKGIGHVATVSEVKQLLAGL